jgi:hypothetical protein
MIRENEDGDPIPANIAGGRWQIVWIQKDRGDSSRAD